VNLVDSTQHANFETDVENKDGQINTSKNEPLELHSSHHRLVVLLMRKALSLKKCALELEF
ncbi:hypothetical protein HMI56_005032, partial [Coelomomyces lativittatus]